MNTTLKHPTCFVTSFVFGFLFLISIGCKKDVQINNTETSSTTSVRSAKPLKFSSNTKQDINLDVFVPCANGGVGETANMTGPLHILTTFTISDNFVSGTNHFQPQGISGTGDVTGTKYQATGITDDKFKGSLVNGQYQSTYVNNFRIIGQGTGNNFLVHEIVHLTINANGTATNYVDNFSIECK